MTDDAVDALLEALTGAPSLEAACAGLLTTARGMLGAEVAGLVAWDARGRLEHLASTDAAITSRLCDVPGGPICPPIPEATHPDGVLTVVDLRTEDRWPDWAREVAGAGYLSVQLISLPSMVHRPLALHAWAARPGAFDGDTHPRTIDVVRLAALMIAQTERVEHLAEALRTRSMIAQAQGIVMERFSLDSEQAMAYLRRVSQGRQVKIRDLAQRLVGARDNSTEPSGP
ncbi:ANTAR domain-containing protein [Nocardioides sp. 31GB23]|uniref:ANTAR domain-containing protein n=1 Tax=Nocardioides salarius TaxID=374513 RepID=A0ABS2ME37_9ACTN|nr:ANTAR domain-containing protein [Nocardioides salarius]MBM7509452.1 hypothetical protein [Nocardioides salarius]